jgi:hypothetical protein
MGIGSKLATSRDWPKRHARSDGTFRSGFDVRSGVRWLFWLLMEKPGTATFPLSNNGRATSASGGWKTQMRGERPRFPGFKALAKKVFLKHDKER